VCCKFRLKIDTSIPAPQAFLGVWQLRALLVSCEAAFLPLLWFFHRDLLPQVEISGSWETMTIPPRALHRHLV
jgi:hypothetical protein